ncbi:hypothetical protein B2J88_51705 [Rhodococcus sp. SRB_17]|nr:hypothetical protein [Rhodococcus sp. SRB_17]
MWLIVNLDRCGGPIQVAKESVPGCTDMLGVIFTPTGAFGASPACTAPMRMEWMNGIVPFNHIAAVTVDRPGPTRIDIPIGAAGESADSADAGSTARCRPDEHASTRHACNDGP